MPPLSRLLWRLLVVSVGFVVAVLASLVVAALGLGTVAAGERLIDGDATGLAALIAGLGRGLVVLPILAGVVWPAWGAAALLAEVVGARRLAVHLIGAVVVADVALLGSAPLVGLAQLKTMTALGLVAGFLHWLIAGRDAGVRPVSRRDALEGDPRPTHDGSAKNAVIDRLPPT